MFRKKYISKILEKINLCCNEIPPNLSIIEVNYDYKIKETFATSLYLSPNKLNNAIDKLNNDIYPWETIRDIDDFISVPNAEFQYQRDRYKNAIDFVKKFQKEYFYNEYINKDYKKSYYDPFIDKQQNHHELER